jgi:hypothetical protein
MLYLHDFDGKQLRNKSWYCVCLVTSSTMRIVAVDGIESSRHTTKALGWFQKPTIEGSGFEASVGLASALANPCSHACRI